MQRISTRTKKKMVYPVNKSCGIPIHKRYHNVWNNGRFYQRWSTTGIVATILYSIVICQCNEPLKSKAFNTHPHTYTHVHISSLFISPSQIIMWTKLMRYERKWGKIEISLSILVCGCSLHNRCAVCWWFGCYCWFSCLYKIVCSMFGVCLNTRVNDRDN